MNKTIKIKLIWVPGQNMWHLLNPNDNDSFLYDFKDCKFFRARFPNAPKEKPSTWILNPLERIEDE